METAVLNRERPDEMSSFNRRDSIGFKLETHTSGDADCSPPMLGERSGLEVDGINSQMHLFFVGGARAPDDSEWKRDQYPFAQVLTANIVNNS